MEIILKFYKSSSKYYEPICKLASKFETFSQEKSENILSITENDLRENEKSISEIIGTIANWSKSEYFIDGSKVTVAEINRLIQVIQCEKACACCVFGEEKFCFEDTGWGCKKLSAIQLRKEQYYSYSTEPYWYDFGRFSDGLWHVDKERIKNVLKSEAHRKMLFMCSHFDVSRIETTVDGLLDTIDVEASDEWEYKYRDAPAGMPQTEIVGLCPKQKQRESFGINVRGIIEESVAELREKEAKNKNIPSISFADIGGIDDIVQQVREVIELPLVAPTLFEHYAIKPHKGILLYGPPGCGKTLIAKAVAHEINAHFITVNGPEIFNKYVGQSEENLRKIFADAELKAPSVIYFDEFDAIAATRDTDGNPLMAGVVNQLLTLMDGMNSSNQICCIASTNRIDIIDGAIKRPGRFDYVIEIHKPSPEGCKAIFKIHTAKMPVVPTFNKDAFVEKYLVGCSGADIAFVVAEAAYNSIRRTVNIKELFSSPDTFQVAEENVITEMDFIRAATTLKNNRVKEESAKYRYNQ